MDDTTQAIHQKALEAAARFKRAEADLISILQEVEGSRVFMKLGYTSLFAYSVEALGLSESVAANFITVSRKAKEVPVLQAERLQSPEDHAGPDPGESRGMGRESPSAFYAETGTRSSQTGSSNRSP
jgi:hypothetical protein